MVIITPLIVSLLAVLSGCSSLAPDSDSAGAAAEDFHRALADGDGSAACTLLAPETIAVVEQDSSQSCADAVLDQNVPDGGAESHEERRPRSFIASMAARS